eukprot:319468-Pyramimonas_sp.AAC.1
MGAHGGPWAPAPRNPGSGYLKQLASQAATLPHLDELQLGGSLPAYLLAARSPPGSAEYLSCQILKMSLANSRQQFKSLASDE